MARQQSEHLYDTVDSSAPAVMPVQEDYELPSLTKAAVTKPGNQGLDGASRERRLSTGSENDSGIIRRGSISDMIRASERGGVPPTTNSGLAKAKGHVPSKKIVDGAALMKFQQLNADNSNTHLDHSELEDNASFRQMDRDGDGKVSVVEFMLRPAETPLVPTTPAHPVRSARKIPVHAPGCVPDVLSQLRLA